MTTSFKINSIETERLILREITPAVYRVAFSSWNDEDISDFFGLASSAELLNEKLKYQDGLTTFNRSFLFFHLVEKSTGDLIGWCGFHTWYLSHRRAEIGYELYAENKRGTGIMKEAIGPIIRYGFKTMKLNRIEAFIGPGNVPSIKLIKSLGFTEEGLLRKNYLKDERFEDSAVFSLLEEEYSGLK